METAKHQSVVDTELREIREAVNPNRGLLMAVKEVIIKGMGTLAIEDSEERDNRANLATFCDEFLDV